MKLTGISAAVVIFATAAIANPITPGEVNSTNTVRSGISVRFGRRRRQRRQDHDQPWQRQLCCMPCCNRAE